MKGGVQPDGRPPTRRTAIQWLLGKPKPIRVPLAEPVVLDLKDGKHSERVGISCSGGGIRSAAFCLGALQALREKGEIGPKTVVSAVSGGSYIASSWVAVKQESDEGAFEGNFPDVYAPGSPEEQHLRNNSTYMAPGVTGFAKLLTRVFIGTFVNLAMIVSVLAVVAWPLSRLYDEIYGLGEISATEPGALSQVPPELAIFTLAAVGAGLLLALTDFVWRIRREWVRILLESWSHRMLCLAGLAAALLIALPALVIWAGTFELDPAFFDSVGKLGNVESLAALGGGSVVLAILGALRTLVARRPTVFAMAAGAIAAPTLVLSTVIAFMLGYLRDDGGVDVNGNWALVSLALIIVAWLWVDLTQWSLHPFYRRRVSSAFFTKRKLVHERASGNQPDPENEADPRIEIEPLAWDEPLYVTQLRPDPFELIVCAAANISTYGIVPPGRSATPFTFSASEIAAPLLGPLVKEGDKQVNSAESWLGERASKDITLPAAVAISGAAVAPSMGKKTKRALTMLMAMLNVRLGVWMPNPRRLDGLLTSRFFFHSRHDESKRDFTRKRPTPVYLLKEMLGMSGVDDRFLYVSDGGHYDNLGLIELLRRGCTRIYCLDGGGDPMGTFRALGEATALARSDLQVEVAVNPEPSMVPNEERIAEANHVTGTVRYLTDDPSIDRYQGRIAYTRATITADAPQDVLAYREKTRKFPYHSTLDQLFDDQKFEAYRALGSHCAIQAFEAMTEEAFPSARVAAEKLGEPKGS